MSSSGSDLDHLEEGSDPQAQSFAAKKRRLWTKQEDEKLRLLVSYWGDQSGRQSNWDKIAAQFTNRNAKNCRKRWFHSLDPKLRRGKWSPNEDKVLLEAYEQLGPSWQRIAQLIPGRTDDQCSKRYTDVLDPAVHNRLRPWSEEEDRKLLELYKKHGRKWQAIAAGIEGRTGLVCRNRWRKLTKPPKESNAQQGSAIAGDGSESLTGDGLNNNEGNLNDQADMGDVGGFSAFEVPGSTGFPAGADANWFQTMGHGRSNNLQYPTAIQTGLNIPDGVQKHVTITIEGPGTDHLDVIDQPTTSGSRHHTISPEQLERLVSFASDHGKQIIVHQHIYQTPLPSPPQQQTPQVHHSPRSQQRSHAIPQHQQQQAQLAHIEPVAQPPQQPRVQPSVHQDIPNIMPHDMNSFPPVNHKAEHDKSLGLGSSENKNKAPTLPDVHYSQPPDEFLSRPLLYEDPPPPEMMALPYEEVDFLAFNPS